MSNRYRNPEFDKTIPYGYCHCGCGEKAPLAKKTLKSRGFEKGKPHRFIHNHHLRSMPFDFYVKKLANGCWEWQGTRGREGHGMYSLNGKNIMAHRYAYERSYGKILPGMIVRHFECDNPPCVNPEHLKLGTPQDNTNDAIRKGRHKLGRPLEEKEKMYQDWISGESLQELSIKYNLSYGSTQRYISKRNKENIILYNPRKVNLGLKMHKNLILSSDSYKLTHHSMYPEGTETIYSYFESRSGATYPYTVFFGLQAILRDYLAGQVVTYQDLSEALKLSTAHFGSSELFNYQGWAHIIEDHAGRLPLRIKAVPEGTVVPTGNVLMTVENTCPKCFWLTNAMESLLTHVWYPSTVATLSRSTKEMIKSYLDRTADSDAGLPFMLHDFGYRGASSHETAALGGAGHLVNFSGTDTLPAMEVAIHHYDADLNSLAFSVPATEHSIMTSLGPDGEIDIVDNLIDEYPEGILSVVADSYNIYNFVEAIGTTFKDRILAREGVFVVRPDSITAKHTTPEDLTLWIVDSLDRHFGSTVNSRAYKVLNPKVRVLWGDGIDPSGIDKILDKLTYHHYSAENMVFGMGGGLLQKVNRDTQRFAFKCSAAKRNGEWYDIYKDPIDSSKASKKGRLILTKEHNEFVTKPWDHTAFGDLLQTVFEDGHMIGLQSFDEIRARAALTVGKESATLVS